VGFHSLDLRIDHDFASRYEDQSDLDYVVDVVLGVQVRSAARTFHTGHEAGFLE